MTLNPTPADKFTFGLWTVGWQARDPFGDATRDALALDVSRFPTENIDLPTEYGGFLQNAKIVSVSYRIRLATENRISRIDWCCNPYAPRRFAYCT